MTAPKPKTDVTYRSGTSEGLGLGWDVMLVIYRQEDGGQMRIANSFAIARDASGKIIRKIDSFPEQWEIVSDADALRGFRQCFDERDRLAARVPPFFADCPACNKKVTAFLVQGSLENLQKGEGDVKLAHPTNDPHEGDHRWILNDPQAKARLRKLIGEAACRSQQPVV